MPASTRPLVGNINLYDVTPDVINVTHSDTRAWVQLGTVAAMFSPMDGDRTVVDELNEIRDIGAAIVSQATAQLALLDRDDRHGHTEKDFAALVAAGVDPASTQPREHSVRCTWCLRPTMNQSGNCDRDEHYTAPWAARKVAS